MRRLTWSQVLEHYLAGVLSCLSKVVVYAGCRIRGLSSPASGNGKSRRQKPARLATIGEDEDVDEDLS